MSDAGRFAGVVAALATLVAGAGAEGELAPLDIRSFETDGARARVAVRYGPFAGDGMTTVEMYRATAMTGPWGFVTNDLLDGGAIMSDDRCVTRTYEVGCDTNAAAFFLAALFFADSDEDGLSDCYERHVTKTDPNVADSDGDGVSDGAELASGEDPLTPDSDRDGMDDEWERMNGLDAYNPDDAFWDLDGDGLGNFEEYLYGTSPEMTDSDTDGFDDFYEAQYSVRLHPVEAAEQGWLRYFDPRGDWEYERDRAMREMDSFSLQVEYEIGTNPMVDDTDGDGLPDWWEYEYGLDPLDASGDNGADGDPDADWLTNIQEYEADTLPNMADTDADGAYDYMEVMVYNTNPNDSDTDGDGISDGDECEILHTDPLSSDSDADGLTDYEEINIYYTDPLQEDTDGDGGSDYQEVVDYNTDPNDASEDRDGDGLLDLWEAQFGMDPDNYDFADYDADLDGLTALEECVIWTDPFEPDTDDDGMHDGWEYQYFAKGGFDPAVDNATDANLENDFNEDPDGDGLCNGLECTYATNPLVPDTDGDGVTDGIEVGNGTNPRDPTDCGIAGRRVNMTVLFGDPSSSHSEKYLLKIYPKDDESEAAENEVYELLNRDYGKVEAYDLSFRENVEYCAALLHASTTRSYEGYPYPDPDYSLEFKLDFRWKVEMKDPDKLCGSYSDSDGTYVGEDKELTFKVVRENFKIALLPDYNRDGMIDETDRVIRGRNTPLRFWVNDDRDSAGDSACTDDGSVDMPGSVSNDANDEEVNGKRDIVDFTPLWLDLSSFSNCHDTANLNVILKQEDEAVNFVWTSLKPLEVGNFLTADLEQYGPNCSDELHKADVAVLDHGGCGLSATIVENWIHSRPQGVFLIEGRQATQKPLTVEVSYEEELLASTKLPLSISSVQDMYRWLNLRDMLLTDVHTNSSSFTNIKSKRASAMGEPANRPDSDTDGRHYVFVHGYNVDADGAEAWSAEIFKRLWQAGLAASFTSVDWLGNETQIDSSIFGKITPNYYINVKNAFLTAGPLTKQLNALEGQKVMLAHSLGNVVVSAAAADYNLSYTKYYMINAAVAQEAYNPDAHAELMVEGDWREMPSYFRSSGYYKLFDSDDFRAQLYWKGRFANIKNFVNCYSPTEDVLTNPGYNVFLFIKISENNGSSWSRQELYKGCIVWDGVNLVTRTQTLIEGGWGVKGTYSGAFSYNDYKNWTTDQMITNALFCPFLDARLQQMKMPIPENEEECYALRATLLGDAIPAESYAAGANELLATKYKNINMCKCASEADVKNWPRGKTDNVVEWYHSDWKNVAYRYVHVFFEKLVSGAEQ